MSKNTKTPNPYFLALLTAIFSGMFAVSGVYLTSELAKSRSYEENNIKLRNTAYASFINKIASNKNNGLAKIHYAGILARNSLTDYEIQEVEDYLSTPISMLNNEVVVNLNQEFNILRSVGSKEVRRIVEDLFLALGRREREIIIKNYSKDFQWSFVSWNPDKSQVLPKDISPELRPMLEWLQSTSNKEERYFDVKVSDEDRTAKPF